MYDPLNTDIKLGDDFVLIRIVNMSVDASLDYEVATQPELVQEVGTGRAWLTDLNITIVAKPKVHNHFFQFDFDQIEIDAVDIGLNMTGGDISLLVNTFFADTLVAFIKEYLLGSMNQQTKQALQGVVNDLLMTVPREVQVGDAALLEIDYGLLEDNGLIVTEEYLSIVADGTFHLVSEQEPDRKDFTVMPVHVAEGEEVQVLISEYTLNQLLLSVVKLDLLQFATNSTSDNVDAMISDFERAYGDQPNVTVTVDAAPDAVPKIKISK